MGNLVYCTGTFERSMDGKQRILLPKSLRLFLAGVDSLFLSPGTDGCIEIHNETSLSRLASDSQNSQAAYQSKTTFSRIFFAQSERCQVDSNHRLRVAGSLSELAGLVSPVVIVGVGNHWEIWNRQNWHDYLSRHQSNFDHHAELVRGGSKDCEIVKEVSNKPR